VATNFTPWSLSSWDGALVSTIHHIIPSIQSMSTRLKGCACGAGWTHAQQGAWGRAAVPDGRVHHDPSYNTFNSIYVYTVEGLRLWGGVDTRAARRMGAGGGARRKGAPRSII
jgi:hypothetical protein